MAFTVQGQLAELMQDIQTRGVPSKDALQAKLGAIYECAAEDADVLREANRMEGRSDAFTL